MHVLVLILYAAVLAACIVLGISTPYALLCGLVIFIAYALHEGFSLREIVKMLISRFNLVKHLFILFALIGIMTAVWRASGTIQTIVCYAVDLLSPSTFLMMSFLINCAVSFIMGTSFGTAATFGVICMSIGITMGINTVQLGGAIISGVYFGDRCSPVSSTALLVAMITETDIHSNVRRMIREALVPVIMSCILFFILGHSFNGHQGDVAVISLFRGQYSIGTAALVPVAVILVMSVLKVKIIYAVLLSTATAFVTAVAVQGADVSSLLKMCLTGYEASDPDVAAIINGGGFMSMATCMIMSTFAAMYAGIFQGTGLLDILKDLLMFLSKKVSAFFAVMTSVTAVIMLSCSQTLPVMLFADIVREIERSDQDAAMDFENSTITIAPLVPWTIASTVPLVTIGATQGSLIFAFYLYLLPLYTLAVSIVRRRQVDQQISLK